MDDKLRLAMVAARAGQKKEAQYLLTQVLRDNPQEANAWYLLSHLVDSEQKQIAYLEKVVALDPDHQKAAEQLAEMTGLTKTAEIEESETVLATQPDWEPAPNIVESMPDDSDEAVDWLEELAVTAAEDNSPPTAETMIVEIPEPATKFMPEAAETAVSIATVMPPVQVEPVTDDTSKQLQRLNITLAILAVLMIIVLYFLFTALF